MERYDAFLRVGEGSFGSVHKATDKETGEIVAVKVFHNTDEEVVRAAIREARFLSACNHCNITGLREAYRSGSGRIYLVLEFAEHVLSQQLKLHRRGLPGAAVRSIIFQLLQALKYLHDRNIMHRDCKPANILITSEGMVKLCDFGFARYVESGSRPPGEGHIEPLTSYVITRWYRPPEVLVGQAYSTSVDIWAVGCIFAEMVTGAPLFPGASHLDQLYITIRGLGGLSQEQVAAVRANKKLAAAALGNTGRSQSHSGLGDEEQGTVFERLAPHMTRSMMQFMQACLEPDPKRRATADELLAMPYMKEGAWEASAEHASASAPAPAQPPAPSVSASAHVTNSGGSSRTVQGQPASSADVVMEDAPPPGALVSDGVDRAPHSTPLPPMYEVDEGEETGMEVDRSSMPTLGSAATSQQRSLGYRSRVTIPQGMGSASPADGSAQDGPDVGRRIAGVHDSAASLTQRRQATLTTPIKPSKLGPISAPAQEPKPATVRSSAPLRVTVGASGNSPPHPKALSPDKSPPVGLGLAPHPPKTGLSNFQARAMRRAASTSGAECPADHAQGPGCDLDADTGPDSAGGARDAMAAQFARPASPNRGDKQQAAGGARGLTAQSTAAAITKLSTVAQTGGIGSIGTGRVVNMERSCSMPGQVLNAVPRCPAPPAMGHVNAAADGRPNIGGHVVHLRESQFSMDGSEPQSSVQGMHPGWTGAGLRKGASPLHSGMRLQRMHVSPEAGLVSAGPSSLNSSNDSTATGLPPHQQNNPIAIAAALASAGPSSLAGPPTGQSQAGSSPIRRGPSSPSLSSRMSAPSTMPMRSRSPSGTGEGPAQAISCSGLPSSMGTGPVSAPQSVLSRFGRALSLMGSRGKGDALSGARSSSHRLSTSSLSLDAQ